MAFESFDALGDAPGFARFERLDLGELAPQRPVRAHDAGGDLNGPAQRSHILSADAIYDVNGWLSVGAKYGMRIGDQRARGATDWTRADAHLAILRADFHVMRQWDALAEARALWSPSADTVDYGALIALYRHVGDNLKVGVGYNFGRFSDDLRDLTLDDQGVFLNVVGKF